MHIGILSVPANFHCQKWAAALVQAGARVTVFTLDAAPGEVAGAAVVRIPVRRHPYRFWDYLRTARALRAALDAAQVDVLHPLGLSPFGVWGLASGFRPLVPAAIGADVLEYPPRFRDLRRSPALRTWAETEPATGLAARLRAWLRWRLYRQAVRAVVRGSWAITADNQPLVDALTDYLDADAAKVHLLRWGLDPAELDAAAQPAAQAATRAAFGIPAEANVLLSPRGLNAFYQADVLVAALAQLLADPAQPLAGWTVVLLGAGYPASARVLRAAQALAGAHPNVRVIAEQLPRAELTRLWGLTDVFVSAPVYDGYSAAVAEGRYAGAVPVVNRIPGNEEVLRHGETAWFADPFTPDALAEALRTVLPQAAALRAQFGPRNRDWVLAHSVLANNAQRFLALAAEALRGSPAAAY